MTLLFFWKNSVIESSSKSSQDGVCSQDYNKTLLVWIGSLRDKISAPWDHSETVWGDPIDQIHSNEDILRKVLSPE